MDSASAGRGGQLPAEKGICFKERKVDQGGKRHFTKSLGMEAVHGRVSESS